MTIYFSYGSFSFIDVCHSMWIFAILYFWTFLLDFYFIFWSFVTLIVEPVKYDHLKVMNIIILLLSEANIFNNACPRNMDILPIKVWDAHPHPQVNHVNWTDYPTVLWESSWIMLKKKHPNLSIWSWLFKLGVSLVESGRVHFEKGRLEFGAWK